MFFGSATALFVTVRLIQLLALFCVIHLFVRKDFFRTFLIFSIGTNAIFLLNSGSMMFVSYDIMWLKYLSLTLWPLLNAYLVYRYRVREQASSE